MLKEKCNRVKPTPASDNSSRGEVSEETTDNSSSCGSEEGGSEGSEDPVSVRGEEEKGDEETENSVKVEDEWSDVCGNVEEEEAEEEETLNSPKILQEKQRPPRGEAFITSTSLTCSNCRKIFTRRDNCQRHTKTCATSSK
jgi:hypothetical protein